MTGFQTAREAPYPLQASACCKHFVANEYEGHRYGMDVNLSAQDLVDSYLPPFQACVEEGKVSGIMCAYNAVNGEPCCANEWLLGDLLRTSWSFDGYVTSDCDAEWDNSMIARYPNNDDAVAAILRAGTDVNCGAFMKTFAPHALANGNITEADLDVILRRQFRTRLRLGHFDGSSALDSIGVDQICTPFSLELARDAARQSAVLAKNDAGTLPLAAGSFASAVVIGPLINLRDTVTYYGSYPCNGSFITPLLAVREHLPAAVGILGVNNVTTNDTSGVAAAAAAAAAADLVLLTIGSDGSLETEGLDRSAIDFSAAQVALITAVTAAAKGTVVALVFSGGAMDVSILLANPKIVAVVICGQPSVAVEGTLDAIFGRTLDGRAVAMAGRMSQMTYPASFVNEVNMCERRPRPAFPPARACTHAHLHSDGNRAACRSPQNRRRRLRNAPGPLGVAPIHHSGVSGARPPARPARPLAHAIRTTPLPDRVRRTGAPTASTMARRCCRTVSASPTRPGSTCPSRGPRRPTLRPSTPPQRRTPAAASSATSRRASRPGPRTSGLM